MLELTIKINNIAEDGENLEVPFSRQLLKDALDGMEMDIAASSVTARMHLSRVGDTVSVRGSLDGNLKGECARCLGEAHIVIHAPLNITIGAEDLGAEESVEDEVEYFTHDGERIELEHVLREALIFSVPMSVVCRESCKGLCVVCGADRNTTDCGHSQAVLDPRLTPLKDLKLD